MNKFYILLVSALCYNTISAQYIVKIEIKNPIEGLCNDKEVYSLFPYMDKGQIKAVPPVSKVGIITKLNEIDFLKANPKYNSKGMIKVIINCWGEVVLCEMDVKTKNVELDKETIKVYDNLGTWKNATLNGNAVDNVQLINFRIKKGIFFFE